jgi:hypothetical protein
MYFFQKVGRYYRNIVYNRMRGVIYYDTLDVTINRFCWIYFVGHATGFHR